MRSLVGAITCGACLGGPSIAALMDCGLGEDEMVARLYDLARQERWEVVFLTKRPPSGGARFILELPITVGEITT